MNAINIIFDLWDNLYFISNTKIGRAILGQNDYNYLE